MGVEVFDRIPAQMFGFGRTLAALTLERAGGLLVEFGEVVEGRADPLTAAGRAVPLPQSAPFPEPYEHGGDVCAPLASPGERALLAAVLAERSMAQGSTLVASSVWEPAFAFEVKPRALLALDGPDGQRAMRVTRLLHRERPGGYGPPTPGVTFRNCNSPRSCYETSPRRCPRRCGSQCPGTWPTGCTRRTTRTCSTSAYPQR